MDNKNIFSALCSLYVSSETPSAVIQEKEKWENAGFKKLFSACGKEEKEKFFSDISDKNGISYEKAGNSLLRVSIMKTEGVSVIQITKADDISALLGNPAINGFVRHILNRMRVTLSNVSACSNFLQNMAQTDISALTSELLNSKLGSMEDTLADFLGECIESEQIVSLLDGKSGDSTICVTDEISKIVRDIKFVTDDEVTFEAEYCSSAYARLNRGAFRLIFTDIAAMLCSGRYAPDKIRISTDFCSESFAEVTMTSDCSSERPQEKPCVSGGKIMFFDYLVGVFCERYGGSFTSKQLENGESFSVSFPIIVSEYAEFASPEKYSSVGRFDEVSIRFGRKKRRGTEN